MIGKIPTTADENESENSRIVAISKTLFNEQQVAVIDALGPRGNVRITGWDGVTAEPGTEATAHLQKSFVLILHQTGQ